MTYNQDKSKQIYKLRKAIKKAVPLRVLLFGDSGAGKTYSALRLAKGLSNGGKIGVIDTENRSEQYADEFDFDVIDLESPFIPQKFEGALNEFELNKYNVVIIDNISDEWSGLGGVLDKMEMLKEVDQSKKIDRLKWVRAKKESKAMLKSMLLSNAHIIFCAMEKDVYKMVKDKEGKYDLQVTGVTFLQDKDFERPMDLTFRLQNGGECSPTKKQNGLSQALGIVEKQMLTEDHGAAMLKYRSRGVATDLTVDRQKHRDREAKMANGLKIAQTRDKAKLIEWYKGLTEEERNDFTESGLIDECKVILENSNDFLEEENDCSHLNYIGEPQKPGDEFNLTPANKEETK